MAEQETEQITPVASTPAVASLSSGTPATVYNPINVSQIDIPSEGSASSMKLSDMENKLAEASSQAELNQIEIMNQPKAMGVLTGEAAYQSRLDTARVNAFNNLYQNRLAEEQRKDEERQLFMQNYGADPSQRPEGMSKKEFAKALNNGQFQELLSPELRASRAKAAKGSTKKEGLYQLVTRMKNEGKNWGEIANEAGNAGFDLTPGSADSQQLDTLMTGQVPQQPIVPKKVGVDENGEDIFVDSSTGERIYWVD